MGLRLRYCISIIIPLIFLWLPAEGYKPPGICSQYKVDVEYIKECGSGKKYPFLHLLNMTVEVTDDCKVYPRGCVKLKKGANNADTIKYFYDGKFGKYDGNLSICEALEGEMVSYYLEPYDELRGFSCPFQEGATKCNRDGYTDVSQNIQYFEPSIGRHEVSAHIYNSKTPKNYYCLKGAIVISRKKKFG